MDAALQLEKSSQGNRYSTQSCERQWSRAHLIDHTCPLTCTAWDLPSHVHGLLPPPSFLVLAPAVSCGSSFVCFYRSVCLFRSSALFCKFASLGFDFKLSPESEEGAKLQSRLIPSSKFQEAPSQDGVVAEASQAGAGRERGRGLLHIHRLDAVAVSSRRHHRGQVSGSLSLTHSGMH
jgi:hypothetical protein